MSLSLDRDHDPEHLDRDLWTMDRIAILAVSLVFVSSTMVHGRLLIAVGFWFVCLSLWFLSCHYIGYSGEVYYFVSFCYMLYLW